jgi:hypothetical protein
MNALIDAYDLKISQLMKLYKDLNREIKFPDGMVTKLGIIFWGEEAHYDGLKKAIPKIKSIGISRFGELYDAIRTPARAKQFIAATGIAPNIVKLLKHDIELWMPKSVPLDELEPFKKNPAYVKKLAENDINDQLQLISAGQNPAQRKKLAKQTGIPLKTIAQLVKYCDAFRMEYDAKHIRAKLYFDMGLDTWQKWAESSSEKIIDMFTKYVKKTGLEEKRLIPWPKEVRNGIEWAKKHLSVFKVRW